MPRHLAAAAATLSALTFLLTPSTAYAASPGDTVVLPVRKALARLPVCPSARLPVCDEDPAGYERIKFRHRFDADHDRCTTRAEVLKSKAVRPCTRRGTSFSSSALVTASRPRPR
ncbi:hypothetical protein ACIRPX_42545 [Streptomyces sp. NPDC101225]|uniref:hypothetical protein n=1 Tax=Streptomyces sp. NPDC101225 TaxID=3366135 RepID=UPI00382904EC